MMRFCVFLLACAALFPADDFMTGQAARLIIGQDTFTRQDPRSSDTVLGGAGGVAYANNMLFVADSNRVGASPSNHRVLIFRDLSLQIPRPNDPLPQLQRCPACVGRANLVLGQPDFVKTEFGRSQAKLRLPTSVATDGVRLAIADTDNNRVLVWNRIPATNNANADLVIGQPDFNLAQVSRPPTSKLLLGPQGVWILGNRLIVADTLNHRVLIWNNWPTQNGQAADVVLGQPNFETFVDQDPLRSTADPKANNMLNPVSVTSDGQRLFVADLGYNRVLIWNSIPTQNQQPADVVIGQPDFTSGPGNNSLKLCESDGEFDGQPTYPPVCESTLSYPRFVLAAGSRLFVSDGGNDRILVFNKIPTANGAKADQILGQPSPVLLRNSDSAYPLRRSASDALRTPIALAHDGTNLYVADPFNRRVLVFSVGANSIPQTGVRNDASLDVRAVGYVSLSGTPKENDEATLKINDREYKYKQKKDDKIDTVAQALTNAINGSNGGFGDKEAFASSPDQDYILLTSKLPGVLGNKIEISFSASDGATITGTTSGATLSGGGEASQVGPGTIVSLFGEDLSAETVSAPADAKVLPTELGGVQVYFDGILAPLYSVSPKRVVAQVPWEVQDSNSINAWVRTTRPNGQVTVTTPVGVTIISENPGIYAFEDVEEPRPGRILHFSSSATGTISVDGTAKAGDIGTVVIGDGDTARSYTYTVKDGDTLEIIRDGLIAAVNNDPQVTAYPAGLFTRIRLLAREPGPAGNGLTYSAKVNDGAQVILTATTAALCCANVAGAPVTEENPALPGETIVVYATGLGLVKPDDALRSLATGEAYTGPYLNEPREFVSSLAGGKTANVLYSGLKQGAVGVYEVHLELNSDLPTSPVTQLTIAQSFYVSNVVTLPVFNPTPPE